MDTHPVTYDELIDYVLEALDRARCAAVAEHIERCSQCATTIKRFQIFRVLVRQTYANPPPESIHKVNQLFEQHSPPPTPNPKLRQAFE